MRHPVFGAWAGPRGQDRRVEGPGRRTLLQFWAGPRQVRRRGRQQRRRRCGKGSDASDRRVRLASRAYRRRGGPLVDKCTTCARHRPGGEIGDGMRLRHRCRSEMEGETSAKPSSRGARCRTGRSASGRVRRVAAGVTGGPNDGSSTTGWRPAAAGIDLLGTGATRNETGQAEASNGPGPRPCAPCAEPDIDHIDVDDAVGQVLARALRAS